MRWSSYHVGARRTTGHSGALGLGRGHREPGDALEDGDRGFFGPDETLAAHDERLFERVLAAEARVAGRVRADDPGGVRGKVPAVFGTVALKRLVFLQEMVEPEHELVIGWTVDHWQAQAGERAEHLSAQLAERGQRSGQARLDRVLPGQRLEGVGRDPDPIARGMDVG